MRRRKVMNKNEVLERLKQESVELHDLGYALASGVDIAIGLIEKMEDEPITVEALEASGYVMTYLSKNIYFKSNGVYGINRVSFHVCFGQEFSLIKVFFNNRALQDISDIRANKMSHLTALEEMFLNG